MKRIENSTLNETQHLLRMNNFGRIPKIYESQKLYLFKIEHHLCETNYNSFEPDPAYFEYFNDNRLVQWYPTFFS